MKIRYLVALAVSAVLFLFWVVNFVKIPPGYVGVVVDLFGDKRGVEQQELHVGVYWISPWKSVYRFAVFEQNDTWEGNESFHFQTSEGLACAADVGITYHLDPAAIHKVFAKYRRGMYEITHVFIRNYIRDAINKSASKIKIEDLYGAGKEAFFEEIESHVQSDLSDLGIHVSRIYIIGRFHFPQNVINALNSKIEAIQRAQQRENELRESEAEAKKRIAKVEGDAICVRIAAEADAKANEILTKSLSDHILAKMAIEKWDGKLPTYLGAGMTMMVAPNQNVKPKKSYVND